MKNIFKRLVAAAVLAGCAAGAGADQWPARPITWIVGGAAGGPTDAIARTIAQEVSAKLGQTILIENLGGAGGTIASTKVARARPDGYSFLVGHVGYVAAAPWLYKNLAYDPVRDFDAVFRFPDIPGVVLVSANSPFHNMSDLLAYAKKYPGKLNFGDAGVGSMSNLVAAMLANRAGIEITAVSYKGNGPAMIDLMGGQIDALIDTLNTALPQIKSGKLRALGVTSRQAVKQLPGVAPVADLLPAFEGTVWFGIYAPKNTPKAIVDQLHDAYLQAIRNPEFEAKLVDQGLQPLPESSYAPAAFQQFTASEIKKYETVVKNAHIEPQ